TDDLPPFLLHVLAFPFYREPESSNAPFTWLMCARPSSQRIPITSNRASLFSRPFRVNIVRCRFCHLSLLPYVHRFQRITKPWVRVRAYFNEHQHTPTVLISYDQINLSVRRAVILRNDHIVMTTEKRRGLLFSTSSEYLAVSRFGHDDKVAERPLRNQGSPALLSLSGNLLYGAAS